MMQLKVRVRKRDNHITTTAIESNRDGQQVARGAIERHQLAERLGNSRKVRLGNYKV